MKRILQVYGGDTCWWDEAVEGKGLVDLEQYASALEEQYAAALDLEQLGV
ncbi:hypothetical protein CASFOL_020297 [Castilleja foliolosa]|uniref:Uncharacterized protein n=1 Tax=Castilleja foliolosa TaxID=1961234 RepID=A0ABD3D0F9_9LAMI